jgi:2'-5' RNA ligase
LLALGDAVESMCASIGFPRERRAWTPHVTVARLRMASGHLAAPILGAQDENFGALDVSRLVLYASHLRRDGAIYEVLSEVPLAATHAPPGGFE